MFTSDEVLELLGEAEIAMVSLDFWIKYHDRLDPGKSTTDEAYASLLSFQNGWLACKDFYKIQD
jgi:hypothetical protein